MNRRTAPLILMLACLPWLAGCDLLGLEPASAVAAKKEAEGKAIGGACRHAGRAIEDCYALNKRAEKSAVFVGWREMNDYMRENKIEVVKPELSPALPAPKSAAADTEEDDSGDAGEKAAKADAAKTGQAAGKPAGKKAAAKS
jgi:hypothetical protein